MVARAESQVQRLSGSGDNSVKLQAVRGMKNQCIGSRTQKLHLLAAGAVPQLVGLLAAKGTDPDLVVQAITVLGSLSFKLEDGALAVLSSNGLPLLIEALQSNDANVVKASVRSLQFLLQNADAQKQAVCNKATLERLVKLLASDDPSLRVAAAFSIACLSGQAPKLQLLALEAGAVERLVAMLPLGLQQEECASLALAVISEHNEAVSQRVQQAGGTAYLVDALLSRNAFVRFHAAQVLVRLVQFSCLPEDDNETAVTEPLLGALVQLLEEGDQVAGEGRIVWSHQRSHPCSQPGTVAEMLADLLAARPQLQSRGGDTSAVPHLTALLASEPPLGPTGLRSVLRALAELMLAQEPCRAKLLESPKALPSILKALGLHQPQEVQVAAAECVRALSRSAKTLRLGLCRADLARPLAALLTKGTPAVQAAACAACCNLVLDFSPFKTWLVDEGGLPRLLDATRSMDPELRLNGVWAAQNLAHNADLRVKREIMKGLPWSEAEALLSDSELSVRERSLNLLKNLVAGSTEGHNQVALWAADEGNPDSGPAKLIASLAAPLLPDAGASDLQASHSLLAISNLCTGKEEMQQAVMASAVPPTFVTWLHHENAAVRESATWCIHNLALPRTSPSPSSSTEERRGVFAAAAATGNPRSSARSIPSQWCAELTRLGVPQALAKLDTDSCRAVRRNAANTLDRFPIADRTLNWDDEAVRPAVGPMETS